MGILGSRIGQPWHGGCAPVVAYPDARGWLIETDGAEERRMNTSVRVNFGEPSRPSRRHDKCLRDGASLFVFADLLRSSVIAMTLIVTAVSSQIAGADDPVKILFIGNSFTHGRFDEVRLYNAENVRDVNCPVERIFSYPFPTDYSSDCYPGAAPDGEPFEDWAGLSGTEQKPDPIPVPTLPLPESPVLADPTETFVLDPNFYPTMLRYGPYGGIPGLFKQFTVQVGLDYDVAILAQGAATLQSFCRFRSSVGECTDAAPNRYLTKIANAFVDAPPDAVVLQEQSFKPLPTINALGNRTRGNNEPTRTTSFVNSVNNLQRYIHSLNGEAEIYLYQTHALASYVYTSDNPDKPIFGSSTLEYQESIGTPDPIRYAPYLERDGGSLELMTADLHDAYFGVAAQNPQITGVAPAGDAWMRAIQEGIARRNPFADSESTDRQVSLWDEDPALACCTVPIGYHTSKYGAYLSALVLFGEITGVNPMQLGPNDQVAMALGIDRGIARRLQRVAFRTVSCQHATDEGLPQPGFCTRPATH